MSISSPLSQNYTDNVELSIFNCGQSAAFPAIPGAPGIRDHYLIHLVVSGKGSYKVGGKTYDLVPGDLFLIKPNQLIVYCADSADPWEYYWVGFNGACANRLRSKPPLRTPILSTTARTSTLCGPPLNNILFPVGRTRKVRP